MWVGNYLQYKSRTWPDRSVPDFLTFVTYAQIKKLPFRLDLFYVLKNDSSGMVNGESGQGNLRHAFRGHPAGRPWHGGWSTQGPRSWRSVAATRATAWRPSART